MDEPILQIEQPEREAIKADAHFTDHDLPAVPPPEPTNEVVQEIEEQPVHQEPDNTQEAKWTAATRKAYYDEHPENFAGPDASFPIKDRSDVRDAVRLHGHAANPTLVKRNIIRIAHRLNLQDALPDDWKPENQEAVSVLPPVPVAQPFTPKARVASFRTCWLEDDAISLNGRQYPPDIGNALLADGQNQLTDPNALPLVCFATHDDAENDESRHITGRITKLWREGRKFYAMIDVPDTQIGRDFASMMANGYIKSQSLRASGVALRMVKGKSLPQVTIAPGEKVRLLGIDFTTIPGLVDTARIDTVVLEETSSHHFTDSFAVNPLPIIQETIMDKKEETTIQEASLPQLASGITRGVDDSPTQGDYSKKMMTLPPIEDPAVKGLSPSRRIEESLKTTHDHSAAMLTLPCAPSTQEEGKALNKSNRARLAEMHDLAAKHLNLSCQEAGANMLKSKPQNDDLESQAPAPIPPIQESIPMTPEEMVASLRNAGYSIHVEPPKTPEQLLKEEIEHSLVKHQDMHESRINTKLEEQHAQLDMHESRINTKLEEQHAQLDAQYSRLEEQQHTLLEAINALKVATDPREAPQRKSLVESNYRQEIFSRRSHSLLEQLQPEEVERLAYRYEPLPTSLQNEKGLENAVKEFGQLLAYQIDEKWGIQTSPQ